jgi:hypothetical protein
MAVPRNDYANSINASNGILTSIRIFNQTLGLHTTPGWDDVTGFGTPTSALLSLP